MGVWWAPTYWSKDRLLSVFTWQKVRESSLGSIIRVLIPSWGLQPYDLSTSQGPPPHNITLGIRFQQMNLGQHKHSVVYDNALQLLFWFLYSFLISIRIFSYIYCLFFLLLIVHLCPHLDHVFWEQTKRRQHTVEHRANKEEGRKPFSPVIITACWKVITSTADFWGIWHFYWMPKKTCNLVKLQSDWFLASMVIKRKTT